MATRETLHIVSRIHGLELPAALLRLAGATDSLLLTGDAVLLATQAPAGTVALPCYALQADVEARGLMPRLHEHVQLVDHAGFVELCVQHARSLSWGSA